MLSCMAFSLKHPKIYPQSRSFQRTENPNPNPPSRLLQQSRIPISTKNAATSAPVNSKLTPKSTSMSASASSIAITCRAPNSSVKLQPKWPKPPPKPKTPPNTVTEPKNAGSPSAPPRNPIPLARTLPPHLTHKTTTTLRTTTSHPHHQKAPLSSAKWAGRPVKG